QESWRGIGPGGRQHRNDVGIQQEPAQSSTSREGERLRLVMPASRENQAEYARHVLAVIHSDQRLLDKVGELAALYDELESTQKRYVDLKPPRKSARSRTHPRAL